METLSVVTSAYNEEPVIERFMTDLLKVKIPGVKVDFTIVDNGSTDATHDILERMKKKYDFNLVTNPKPTTGMAAGFQKALNSGTGDYVAVVRSDYQEEPQDIPKMFKQMKDENLDYLVGWRKERKDPYWRLGFSFAYGSIIRLFFNFGIPDVNGAPRIIKRKYIENYSLCSKGMIIDVETLWLVKARGGKIGYCSTIHYPRTTGKSVVSVKFILKTIAHLCEFIWYSRMHKPSPVAN